MRAQARGTIYVGGGDNTAEKNVGNRRVVEVASAEPPASRLFPKTGRCVTAATATTTPLAGMFHPRAVGGRRVSGARHGIGGHRAVVPSAGHLQGSSTVQEPRDQGTGQTVRRRGCSVLSHLRLVLPIRSTGMAKGRAFGNGTRGGCPCDFPGFLFQGWLPL